LLLYAGDTADTADAAEFEGAAVAAVEAAHGELDVYLVAAKRADVGATILPLIIDEDDDFALAYGAAGTTAFLVRPDGYLAYAQTGTALDSDGLVASLRTTFG
jgi:pentachlorophenol monooxygenase